MNWRFAPERRACELATAVRNHLIHVHVELGAAASHPDMQRKHVLMSACENLVAGLNNESVPLVIKLATSMIGIRSGFLQSRIRCDHFARDQILSYAEMFERPLRLCPPQPGARHIDFTEAVGLFAYAHCSRVAGCTRCAHCRHLLQTFSASLPARSAHSVMSKTSEGDTSRDTVFCHH